MGVTTRRSQDSHVWIRNPIIGLSEGRRDYAWDLCNCAILLPASRLLARVRIQGKTLDVQPLMSLRYCGRQLHGEPAIAKDSAACRGDVRGVLSWASMGCRDNVGLMEKKMETTIMGYIGVI